MSVFQEFDKNGKVIKTKDGRSWMFKVKYKDICGNTQTYKSKKYIKQKEAKDGKIEFLKSIDTISTSTIILDDLFKEYEDYISSKKNKDSSNYSDFINYNNHISPSIGKLRACDINLQTIRNFHKIIDEKVYIRNDIKYHYKIEFKQKIHSLLSCILDYAVKMGYIYENMAKRYGNFQTPRDEVIIEEEEIKYQTPKQFYDFISVIEEDELIWEAFFSFAYWTGCRKGEQQAFEIDDIDFEIDETKFNKTLSNKIKGGGYKITNTKNRRNRRIDLLPELKPIMVKLYNHYKTYLNFSEKWFLFGGIRFLPNTTIDNKLSEFYDRIKAKYGYEPLRLSHHQFGRHSHASLLISLGADIEDIAERLGDTPEVIRKTYAHLFPSRRRGIRNIITKKNIEKINKEMERYI